ncbi:cytochrome P450 [Streptomyces fildesensis]|uniref:cytochrome P450 n=1 Tax=Streptomyces fildesensis TaxID=375757 RepID=UPI0018DFD449|nr:cytochrome P450 [Streptomyces fildesensis]
MTTPSTSAHIDLTDIDLFVEGRHHEAFSRLRAEEPVYWNKGGDGNNFWALTRYEDVLWAYREHSLFSSARGAILGGSFRSEDDSAGGKMLVASDLPRHRLLKQQIHPAFSTHIVARVRDQVRALVDRAIERALAEGGCDFASEIATELPAGALMVLLGVGHKQAHELIGLTRRMVGFRDETFVDLGSDQRLRLVWLQAEIFEFFVDILEERRRSPQEDFISVLLGAKINGRPLTEEEIFYNCMNLAVGGNETSSYTACSGLQALIEHPDEYDRLLVEPALIGTGIEEMIRWSSTNAYVQRVAQASMVRGSAQISKGDSVTLWNVSANRDDAQFPDADIFDVARTPNRHLSYGAGIHRCIGAPVAQIELSYLFGTLLSRGIRFRSGGAPRKLRSNFILGTTHMPLEVQ